MINTLQNAFVVFFLSLISLIVAACAYINNPAPNERPEKWAIPIEGKTQELPNLFKVTNNLYRGAEPTDEGYATLKSMGITTIIDLREGHPEKSMIKAGNAGIDRYLHFGYKGSYPDMKTLVSFLKATMLPVYQPIFVHCHYGFSRTGVMMVVYRVIAQGWTKEEAIQEMQYGGYGGNGNHPVWKNLIDFMRELDYEKIKRLLDSERL